MKMRVQFLLKIKKNLIFSSIKKNLILQPNNIIKRLLLNLQKANTYKTRLKAKLFQDLKNVLKILELIQQSATKMFLGNYFVVILKIAIRYKNQLKAKSIQDLKNVVKMLKLIQKSATKMLLGNYFVMILYRKYSHVCLIKMMKT